MILQRFCSHQNQSAHEHHHELQVLRNTALMHRDADAATKSRFLLAQTATDSSRSVACQLVSC